ncbi:UDP-glucuronic acid decarboxylase 1 [Tulasnella sp. 427]|nr:UDP-glucuronic acid decarboxylase 1 [Tulasnella sp. 427]
MATTTNPPRTPMAGQSGYYYPFFPQYAVAPGWGNYVAQPSLYRSPYDAFFSGAPPPNSTQMVIRGALPPPEGFEGEAPEASTSTALVRVKVPPTQRDTPSAYPCPPTEDPDNPPVPIHPYLYEGSAAIVWDVRTSFRNNARRAADKSQPLSSIALKAQAINAGGLNHTSMRILVAAGGYPWIINVKRENGISVADVLTEIAAQMDKEMTDSEKWIAKPDRVAEAEAARKANEGTGAVKIRPEGDGMRRVDWLGKNTRFRGLAHSSHPDYEQLIRKRCHDHEKSNTWILVLDEPSPIMSAGFPPTIRVEPKPKRQETLAAPSPIARPGSALSLRSSPFAMGKDKEGNDIVTVGAHKFGFDSRVSIDLLRSLYLRPHYVATATDTGENSPEEQEEFHSLFVKGDAIDYQSKSIFHPKDNSISYTTLSRFPPVKLLPHADRKRILVTGGAGFVGSHLVDRLMLLGHEVTVLDNFFTGSKTTVSHWVGHPNFEMIRHDVIEPFMIECDQIYHLACPASPPHYQFNAVKTIKTSFMGTLNMLGLAKRTKARFLITSTSEVYGDPEVHPQPEDYWGHVNPIGPRACYDEGKRVAETLTYGFHRQDGVDVRVARIFNTFGPRMNPYDGRVVSNFIIQALKGEDITVYGDGKQTRSFQYIHDLVDGLIFLMNSDETRPVNIGNGDEFTILQFAELVRDLVEKVQKEDGIENPPKGQIVHKAMPPDDPQMRRPDTTRAKEVLGWQPRWTVKMGIEEMVRYYKAKMAEGSI